MQPQEMILISETQANHLKSLGVEAELRYAVPRTIAEALAALVVPAPAKKKAAKKKTRQPSAVKMHVMKGAERALDYMTSSKTRTFAEQIVKCFNGKGNFAIPTDRMFSRVFLVKNMAKEYGYTEKEASGLTSSVWRTGSVLKGYDKGDMLVKVPYRGS